jgi:hypothetical protein
VPRRELFGVTADGETAVTEETALTVEHRQPGHLDHQPLAGAVDRPRDNDAAPGLARVDRTRNLLLGIEAELARDIDPRLAQDGGALGADKAEKGFGRDREAAVRIHLPHEAKRMPAFARLLIGGIVR